MCNREESDLPNHFLPIYVLLGFRVREYKSVDVGGIKYRNSYVFTPLGKTTIKSYCCHSCNQELNKKNKHNKKKSLIWLISTLFITVFFNLIIFKTNASGFYYLVNILLLLIIIVSSSVLVSKTEHDLFEVLKKSNHFKEEINILKNKIDFSSINFLNLRTKEKEEFKNTGYPLKYNKEDLLFVKQDKIITECYSLGHDNNRLWFRIDGEISDFTFNFKVLTGGHRLNLEYIQISQEFKDHSRSEIISFSKYEGIKEL